MAVGRARVCDTIFSCPLSAPAWRSWCLSASLACLPTIVFNTTHTHAHSHQSCSFRPAGMCQLTGSAERGGRLCVSLSRPWYTGTLLAACCVLDWLLREALILKIVRPVVAVSLCMHLYVCLCLGACVAVQGGILLLCGATSAARPGLHHNARTRPIAPCPRYD